MSNSFAKPRTNSQHEVITSDFIGGYMPSIHTNHRTKLGEVSQSKGPNLQNNSSTWGTRHYSCNAYTDRGKDQHIIDAGLKICS